MRRHIPLLIILIIYLFIGTLYVRQTPAWQAPDEPAHYNYVRQLAGGELPVMEVGDYDQAYLEEIVFEQGLPPGADIAPISYEDWQPPLYYLLQTPVFLASRGSLTAARMVSLLMGAGVIILAYALVLRIAPEAQWLALTVAVLVAFVPQHLAIMASVNNDALAELLIAAILYLTIDIGMAAAPPRPARYLLLGVLVGLGYTTKGTVYPLTVVVGLVLLWKAWPKWGALLRSGLLVFLPAALIGVLWWGRNTAVYGGLDVLGKQRHDAVVIGQPRTMEWVAQFGLTGFLERFVETTFNSFWGQFGWMTAPMTYPSWLYPLLWIVTGIALVGLLYAAVIERRNLTRYRAPLLVFPVLFALTAGVFVTYNLQFVQHQGRYLFPALIPIALGMAIGLGIWVRPWRERWPWLVYMVPLGLALALIALDLYALFYVVVPALA